MYVLRWLCMYKARAPDIIEIIYMYVYIYIYTYVCIYNIMYMTYKRKEATITVCAWYFRTIMCMKYSRFLSIIHFDAKKRCPVPGITHLLTSTHSWCITHALCDARWLITTHWVSGSTHSLCITHAWSITHSFSTTPSWSATHTSRSRSRYIYFSNASWRNMINQSHVTYYAYLLLENHAVRMYVFQVLLTHHALSNAHSTS